MMKKLQLLTILMLTSMTSMIMSETCKTGFLCDGKPWQPMQYTCRGTVTCLAYPTLITVQNTNGLTIITADANSKVVVSSVSNIIPGNGIKMIKWYPGYIYYIKDLNGNIISKQHPGTDFTGKRIWNAETDIIK